MEGSAKPENERFPFSRVYFLKGNRGILSGGGRKAVERSGRNLIRGAFVTMLVAAPVKISGVSTIDH